MRYFKLFFLLWSHLLGAQITYFNVQFNYNNYWETTGFSSTESTDSYFITSGFGTPWANIWDTSFVLKINKENGLLSYDKVEFFEGQSAVNVIKLSNRFAIQGYYYFGHDNIEDTDFFICKYTKENGLDASSLHTYGLPSRGDYLYRPIQTSDGGIFSSGWSFTPTGIQSLLLFKCDSNLNQQFFKLYPTNPDGHHFGLGCVETPDKGIIVVGNRRKDIYNDNALVFKVDTLGNVLWGKEWQHNGDTTNVYFQDILAKDDGTYLIVGVKRFDPQIGPAYETFWIVNMDSNGTFLWSKQYDPEFYAGWTRIVPSLDGNYYACGVATVYDLNFPTGFKQYGAISKLSPEGELLWHRKYTMSPPGKNYDVFFNVLATSDGGILCNGTTYENDTTRQNAWIVKLDGNGCIGPGPGCSTDSDEPIELPVGPNAWVAISPNPTSGLFRIEARNEHLIEALRVFDTAGRLVNEQLGLHEKSMEADLGSGPTGVYVVSVLVDGVWNVRQVVKM
ncbi:MAG: T9SS type A sorting domain-containing protein [Saprospiraceae bacterium]|nr:T9SS type A sorting domain-containing protein [Saprospiraceae bacterium]